jgi:hypothetical protein
MHIAVNRDSEKHVNKMYVFVKQAVLWSLFVRRNKAKHNVEGLYSTGLYAFETQLGDQLLSSSVNRLCIN